MIKIIKQFDIYIPNRIRFISYFEVIYMPNAKMFSTEASEPRIINLKQKPR